MPSPPSFEQFFVILLFCTLLHFPHKFFVRFFSHGVVALSEYSVDVSIDCPIDAFNIHAVHRADI